MSGFACGIFIGRDGLSEYAVKQIDAHAIERFGFITQAAGVYADAFPTTSATHVYSRFSFSPSVHWLGFYHPRNQLPDNRTLIQSYLFTVLVYHTIVQNGLSGTAGLFQQTCKSSVLQHFVPRKNHSPRGISVNSLCYFESETTAPWYITSYDTNGVNKMTITTLIAGIIGIIIGFLFANTPFGAKFGFTQKEAEAKQIASSVLDESAIKTQSMLSETITRINQEVQRIETKVAALETNQTAHLAGLQENIKQVLSVSERLNDQTTKLDGALRNNKQMGRWGELQLRRLVELSGMQEYVDFVEQKGTTDVDGRPDMIVRFANDSELYVDSKVSLIAYLDGVAAQDTATRATQAVTQYKALKAHVDTLAKRDYHGKSNSLPFTVMYVQVEGSLAFADEARTEAESIVDYAIARKIIIATPGTMMALLRTANLSWRQRVEVAHALDLLDNVKELSSRMKTFIGHYETHGDALAKALKSYTAMAGSWNTRVVPQLERINEMRPESFATAAVDTPNFDQPTVKTLGG